MDNRCIDITSDNDGDLRMAVQLVMSYHKAVKSWNIKDNKLYLYWHDDKYNKVPYPYNTGDVITFAIRWLETVEPTGNEIDIDGSVGKGFRLRDYSEEPFEAYLVAVIEPIWALYGK